MPSLIPDRDRRAKRSRDATRLRDPQRPRFRRRRARRGIRHDQKMRARGRIHRLAQPPDRNHAAIRNLADRRHQDVEVARQLEMLKPVIEDVDGAAELLLGERAGEMTIGRHADDRRAAPAAPASAARRRRDRPSRGCAVPSDTTTTPSTASARA